MKLRLSEDVNVDGVVWSAGEYELADDYWVGRLRAAGGEVDEEELKSLGMAYSGPVARAERYERLAKIAQLQGALTRAEQWAPVVESQYLAGLKAERELNTLRSQAHEALAALEALGGEELIHEVTGAFYHPDRTEAQPDDIAGGDVSPLRPVDVLRGGSPHEALEQAEQASRPASHPPHPEQRLPSGLSAHAVGASEAANKPKDADEAGFFSTVEKKAEGKPVVDVKDMAKGDPKAAEKLEDKMTGADVREERAKAREAKKEEK
jgi:hypothetical protein